jgi:hypothetical protein
VPAKLVKQTIATIIIRIIIIIIIIVIVEIAVKKLLITRLYKRLKRGRVKLKNDS